MHLGSRSLGRTRSVRAIVIGVLLAAASATLLSLPQAAPAKPLESKDEKQIARWVSALMQQYHVSGKRQLNDEKWQRSLEVYLDTLDPLKLYFFQSDVDEFKQAEQAIDDRLTVSTAAVEHLKLARNIYDRFRQRMQERVDDAMALLDEQHDFTLDEEVIRDGDAAVYSTTSQEARERWRKRIKYDLLVLTADGDVTAQEAVQRLKKRYSSRARLANQTDSEELLEWYLTALTAGFDPHSSYMAPSTLRNFFILMGLKLEGIGASLANEDGDIVIKKVIPGGAASKDGRLEVEDRIVGVGQGTDGELVDVVDMKLNDVVEMIRGPAGSIVRLEVVRDGAGTQTFNITRAKIELKDSEARSEIIEWGSKPNGESLRIGVIDLPSFYTDMEARNEGSDDFKSTTRDVERLLQEFNQKGVDVVLIDLRRNGGGSLTEAVDMTGLFIDEGPVVQVKNPAGRVQRYRDKKPAMAWNGPVVILTSKFSASASEIFAGALQDYGRAIVVGDETTHGKGTVQQLFDVYRTQFRLDPNPKEWGALKLTIQQFYLPSGDSTQKRGVLADVPIPSISTHLPVGEADLDHAIEFDQVPPLEHDMFGMVNAATVETLRKRSAQRRDGSQDFAKLAARIKNYLDRKERKTQTLNLDKFLAERKEMQDEEDALKVDEETERPVFDAENFYNAEVLNIVSDYTAILRDGKIAARPLQKEAAVP